MGANLPRSPERGPIEAQQTVGFTAMPDSLPRSPERGPIEAWHAALHYLRLLTFRAHQSAAPLKRIHPETNGKLYRSPSALTRARPH